MTIGVGGSTALEELKKLQNMTLDIKPITLDEYQARINHAQALMREHNIGALYINAGTNLTYFTGMQWGASERMVGALLPANGELSYIAPHFEEDTIAGFLVLQAPIVTWQEHQSPYDLCIDMLAKSDINRGDIAVDESCSFFLADGLIQAANARGLALNFISSKTITAGCRMHKSLVEIALLQRAKDMTMEVHKAVAKILRVGISTVEVTNFIHQAHLRVGAAKGSYFCIVLFGQDTAFPHGVKAPKCLEVDDMVLIDTGCLVEGYNSDITRSYVFGEANEAQRKVWQHEKDAQAAAFNAATLGATCESVDISARALLAAEGYGPDYQLPGLPHRTGHGIGLDIHEWPYLVRGDKTPLAIGMCFSNEPMLCIPGQFGVRLEDHFYMNEQGAKWFTKPSYSIDDPFGLEA
ncbi:MAG: aminopeptidase P family protein [Psychrobium sp.]|nr:aminopeptidase P family protein [Psychrobium sp.]